MTKLSFSLPLTVCFYIAASRPEQASALSMQMPSSRRAFLNKASVATTGATMGWLLSTQQGHPGGCACGHCGGALQHSASCDCGMCAGGAHVAGCQCGSCVASHDAGCTCGACNMAHDAGCTCGACMEGHGAGCGCGSCAGGIKLGFRPQGAYAFEKREVGGADRSATTAAFNIQNDKTYERLEKSGFALDTRADEQARLADALSSFSYPASSTPSKDKNDNKSKK